MMRSFLTRLVGSVPGSLLLPPSLAICLACATPFPLDDLEKGMTTETVRESFGAPEAIKCFSAKPEGGSEAIGAGSWLVLPSGMEDESCWTYVHEELETFVASKRAPPRWGRVTRVVVHSIFLPLAYPIHVLEKLSGYRDEWTYSPFGVMRKPVVLHFEEEKLLRWEVIEPVPVVRSFDNDWFFYLHKQQMRQLRRDTQIGPDC